MTNTVAWGQ